MFCKVDVEAALKKINVSIANEFCDTDAFEDTLSVDKVASVLY